MKKAKILATLVLILLFSSSLVFAEKSGAVSDVTSTVITWTTDKLSTSQVEYGIGKSYTNTTQEDANLVTRHRVVISGLMPSTSYNYRVISKDAAGKKATSGNLTFVTLSALAKEEPPRISDVEADQIVASGPESPMQKTPQASSSEPVKKASTQEEAKAIKEEEPIKKALMQKGGILLKKGTWQIQPSTTYVHTSANRITLEGYTILPVLLIGEIGIAKVKRDILMETLSAKYGLRNNLQLEMSVPFRYQVNRTVTEGDTIKSDITTSDSGIGDISGGVFYQFAYEKGIRPDAIVGLSIKSRTGKSPYGNDIGIGTGHWGIKGSVVAVKSSDPAILFGSLGYTHNIKRNIDNYGDVAPGGSFDYGFGAAFALNYQLAFSASVSQSLGGKMYINDVAVPGSFTNVISLK